jgi:hypothetical protein
MVVGLTLTAFGAQQVAVSGPFFISCGGDCLVQTQGATYVGNVCVSGPPCIDTETLVLPPTHPDFTFNYVGMLMAVLGSVFFATFYPKRPSSSLPANAIPLSL